jgi:hypothetical protein
MSGLSKSRRNEITLQGAKSREACRPVSTEETAYPDAFKNVANASASGEFSINNKY